MHSMETKALAFSPSQLRIYPRLVAAALTAQSPAPDDRRGWARETSYYILIGIMGILRSEQTVYALSTAPTRGKRAAKETKTTYHK